MITSFRTVVLAAIAALCAASAFAEPEPMPAFIAGQTFETVGVQESGQHWLATITFASVIDPGQPSTITLPDEGCAANMTVVEASEERVVFKQTLTEGFEKCLNHGYFAVSMSEVFLNHVFEMSPLRAMSPVITRGMLHNGSPANYDVLRRLGEQTFPRGPNAANIMGSWETPGWLSRKCDQNLTDEPPEWFAGTEFKGSLAIWTATSEAGGHMFAAWTQDWESSEVIWTELKHHSGTMFEAPDGIYGRDDYHLVSARREHGKTTLTLYNPDAERHERETVFTLCE